MLSYTVFILPVGEGKVKTYSPDFSLYGEYEDYISALKGMQDALDEKVKEITASGQTVAEPLDFIGCIKVARKQQDKFDHSKALVKIIDVKN